MREKKEINLQVGAQVHLCREQAQMTQEQLAEALDVSTQYVSDLERGVVGASVSTLRSLCIVLGVSADTLLFGSADPDRDVVFRNLTAALDHEHFDLLLDIVRSYVKAVASK